MRRKQFILPIEMKEFYSFSALRVVKFPGFGGLVGVQ
jgi:hypothetical protein